MKDFPIAARDVGKTFGVAPVLRGVTLEVSRGEGALVVGHNGSGKSTLVRILVGLSSASSGESFLFGQPAHQLPAQDRRRVGLVSHQSFLYPRLTARENLEFYAALYRLQRPTLRVNELLQRVGLASVADERVGTFSRGMEQRLALARAIIGKPDVLLMDEPFSALDAAGIELAVEMMGEVLHRSGAIVVTAHEALQLGRMALTGYALLRGWLRSAFVAPKVDDTVSRSAAAG